MKRKANAAMLAEFRELDDRYWALHEIYDGLDLGEKAEDAIAVLVEQREAEAAAALRALPQLRAEIATERDALEARREVLGQMIARAAMKLAPGDRAIEKRNGRPFIVEELGFFFENGTDAPTCYAAGPAVNPSGSVSSKLRGHLRLVLPEDFA